MAQLVVLLSVVLFGVYQTEQASFLQKSYIDQINQRANTWKAGVNFNPNTPDELIMRRFGYHQGAKFPQKVSAAWFEPHDDDYDGLTIIPKTFDARKKWKECPRIGDVHDQGNCDSSWAYSASSAFADRMCVATGGKFNQSMSAEDLLFCCMDCGDGCNGGDAGAAWNYFNSHGLVTGGDYGSTEGCKPYQIPPCQNDGQRQNNCTNGPMESNHKCRKSCYPNQSMDYNYDLRFTRDGYYKPQNNKQVQKDLMHKGPLTAKFQLQEDFPSYKSGVYVGDEDLMFLGFLTVKLIGWGVENGTPYWLMVNSWGTQWGDNGLFKIQRGSNNCNVENDIYAGTAFTNSYRSV